MSQPTQPNHRLITTVSFLSLASLACLPTPFAPWLCSSTPDRQTYRQTPTCERASKELTHIYIHTYIHTCTISHPLPTTALRKSLFSFTGIYTFNPAFTYWHLSCPCYRPGLGFGDRSRTTTHWVGRHRAICTRPRTSIGIGTNPGFDWHRSGFFSSASGGPAQHNRSLTTTYPTNAPRRYTRHNYTPQLTYHAPHTGRVHVDHCN
ncbi:hypothetical protein GGR51DRAFT_395370 [Nemania sp. FL0031]|nr:hypothetical protein GGR51DRAFT_395370 [Nemania sp. FL0031]